MQGGGMARRALAVGILAVSLSACGSGGGGGAETPSWAKSAKPSKGGVFVHDSKVPAYNEAVRKSQRDEALKLIREEIKDPAKEGDDEYLAQIRLMGIDALAEFSAKESVMVSADRDAEVKRYYDEGRKYAAGNVYLTAGLIHTRGIYYSKTQRNGLAIALNNEELELWQKQKNTFQVMLALHGLASAYHDSGQFALRDAYRKRALDTAKSYFVAPGKPADVAEWRRYVDVLTTTIDDIAEPGRAAEIHSLWSIAQPIIDRGAGGLRSPHYFGVAFALALAGDEANAAKIFEKGKELATPVGGFTSKTIDTVSCAEANQLTAEKKWPDAVAAWGRCNAMMERQKIAEETSKFRLEGLAHEGAGDPDRALDLFGKYIERIEGTRKSYDVGQRAAFFRSIVRDAYWGRIRILADKARKGGDETKMLEALRASEAVRARQFGELLDQRGATQHGVTSVGALRARLAADDVLLDYVMTRTEIVLFVLTRDKSEVHRIPIDAVALSAEIRALAKALVNPASGASSIDAMTRALSAKVLDPVASAITGKKRLIVLPDGELNAIPFDLLVRAGKPLVDDAVVLLSPSLAYFLGGAGGKSSSSGRGAFAVADPRYPTTLRVGDVRIPTPPRSADRPLFPALPETRREVNAITTALQGEPVEILHGDRASAGAVKRARLKGYRYLHFATHGVLGNQVPSLTEPALVLAEDGPEDAFLSASEAEKLDLDADLTVLSACNTGTGEYLTGEGVLGMSRAFLIAGSRSVVMSLWSVDSAATEQLMTTFYRNLRGSTSDIGEALRLAKLSVRASKATTAGDDRGLVLESRAPKMEMAPLSHPYFWSAFVVVGR